MSAAAKEEIPFQSPDFDMWAPMASDGSGGIYIANPRGIHHMKMCIRDSYNSQDMFDGLLKGMEGFYKERAGGLRALDAAREEDPCWYRKSSMLGMMMYADHFAGSLKGVEGKLDYIAQRRGGRLRHWGRLPGVAGNAFRRG